MMKLRRRFHDPIHPVAGLELVVDGAAPATNGVSHPGCSWLAAVAPTLDCYRCTTCEWSGRISGLWVMDLELVARALSHPPLEVLCAHRGEGKTSQALDVALAIHRAGWVPIIAVPTAVDVIHLRRELADLDLDRDIVVADQDRILNRVEGRGMAIVVVDDVDQWDLGIHHPLFHMGPVPIALITATLPEVPHA